MISLDLDTIKNNIIDNLLDTLSDSARTQDEKELLKQSLKSKIKENTLISETPSGEVTIDADSINKVMNKLYIDSLTTYGILNNMSENISKYNVSYSAYINYVNSRIEEINDALEACRHSLTSIYMPAYHIERFRSSDSFDTTRSLQKTRYDGYFPSYCYCNYENKEHKLTLPLLRQDNSLRYDDRVETAYITPYFQLGRGFINLENDETDIENCLDDSESDFWNTSILSDSKLEVSFNDKRPDVLYAGDGYYYDIDNGAVCELEINFESVNTVNELILNPCCSYALRIVAVRYKQTDDDDEPLTELIWPDNSQEMLKDKFTKSQVSYKFPDILCKKIYILFVQEHYLRKTFVYNPQDIYKNSLWFDSKNNAKSKIKEAEFQPNYSDRKLNSTIWNNVNDNVITRENKDLAAMIIGDSQDNRKVIKYDYNYGFYNISCYNNHYDRAGFYVSKMIDLGTNIRTIKIYTDEVHQKDTLNHYVTDIEYYIAGSETPTMDDWIPILPQNVSVIKSELLEITGGTYAYLRFKTDTILSVMKNGEPIDLSKTNDVIFVNDYSINPKKGHYYAIELPNYDYDAVYSVSYVPLEGYDVLDLSNKLSTSIESFDGSNKTFFILNDEPYVDETDNYCSVKLTDVSKNSTGTEIEVENVTEVSNQSIGYKNFKSTGSYQYYIYKNAIYFNKEIPKNYIVDVSYRHLISKFRMKAIFRRNSTKDGWLTPILNEIKYDIETY